MKKERKTKDNFDPEKQFRKLYEKALKLGLTGKDFEKMEAMQRLKLNYTTLESTVIIVCGAILILLSFILLIALVYLLQWPASNETLLRSLFWVQGLKLEDEPCVIPMPDAIVHAFRPPTGCHMCENITKVEYVANITREEFEANYAYTGIPVVIVDGTDKWTAPQHFSFNFFKNLYKQGSPALRNVEDKCQFFPYKTSFVTLGEVFAMSKERANMEDGAEPWYIGWSNCDFSAANVLRKHYKRPYFLPLSSESSKTDWIFMGSPGYGAHLHIDNVQNPSWQAQITGTKKWTLEPPSECYYTCPNRLEVTVHPGQIIVLDTNIWFHSTLNVGDDISITIGSEYD